MVLCNLCGNSEYKVLYEAKNSENYNYYSSGNYGRIVKCEQCGLIYTDPKDKNIEKIYKNIEDKDYLKSKEARIENSKRDLKNIMKLKKSGKLLDIGCGPGLFLKVARDKGFDVCGIELSKWACDIARKEGLNVLNKSLKSAGLERDSFDIVTMWDVIEHIEDPNGIIRDTNKILKKDGLLVLNTPNIGSFYAKLMGNKWWNLMRMHIYYFDKKTIRKLLEKNGFKVLKIKDYSRIIIPRYAVEWLKQYKFVYKLFKFIFDKTFIGNLKLRANFHDNMIVYAKKI